jgi:hypothetical protein
MPIANAEPTGTTAIDAVFEKLLSDIVGGVHPAGARLPAERELSRQLGASRPTLREALRRLGEWHLVEPRRGSGVVVRPYRDWSIEVLAGYMRYGKPAPGQAPITRILLDMLSLRRAKELFDRALAHAWDDEHGGICYGFAPDGSICDGEKYFWVQAESLAAAALLHARTGEAVYDDWYRRLWTYAWEHFVDHRHGAR